MLCLKNGTISHDVPIWIISSYSKIGQEEARVLYHLKSGFSNSGWESQSIYGLFNVEAVSTTYILAYAQSQGIPVHVINRENLYDILPKLKVAQWIKNWIINDVNAGHQVIIPEQELVIGQWRGTGWAFIDENGLGAYIITGGLYESTLFGGQGTEVMNMHLAVAFPGIFEYDPLTNAYIMKEEAELELVRNLLVFFIGLTFTLLLLAAGAPFTVTIMLAIIPLVVLAAMLGPDAIVSGWLDTNKKLLEQLFPKLAPMIALVGAILLALTIISIINYAKIAMDPDGEVVVT